MTAMPGIGLKVKIALLENVHKAAKENLEDKGHQVEVFPSSFSCDELIGLLKGFQAVGIRSKTSMTEQVLEQSSHLEVIGCFCIGTNQVNLNIAKKKGIPVFNAPYSNTRSVAELAMCEVVALSRRLFDRSRDVHQGLWQKSASGSFEVRGKTMGIVGYGHIGSQVSILAEAYGLKVIFFDVIKKLPLGNSKPVDSLGELLCQSDFVSLHVPQTPETRGLISHPEIQNMKKGAFLINTSRGQVVELEAIREALESGYLGGAAIDVYPNEPVKNGENFTTCLQNCRNVILTPHIGGSTQEAQLNIGQEVSEAMHDFLNGGQTTGSVNFPNIQPPRHIQGHRLLNIHENVPGVLGHINSLISQAGINIHSQFLSTESQVGLLLMDIEVGYKQAFEKIRELPTSIKTRIL